MEAPKFSFVVETQETRSQKDKRSLITSIIRSHLAYRQHSRRKPKPGKQVRRQSPIKSPVPNRKPLSEQMSDEKPSTRLQAHTLEPKTSSFSPVIPSPASIYSPSGIVETVASDRLSPFALEYHLDEDELLNSLYQSSLDADFFPQIPTEFFTEEDLSYCTTAESSPMMLTPSPSRISLDLVEDETGGRQNIGFGSAQLLNGELNTSLYLNTDWFSNQYIQSVSNRPPLLDDRNDIDCGAKHTQYRNSTTPPRSTPLYSNQWPISYQSVQMPYIYHIDAT